MASKIDWDYWRHKYVAGDDSVTLDHLSNLPNAPKLSTLKKQAARGLWREHRKTFRNHVGTRVAQSTSAQQAITQIQQLVDAAEIITQHLQLAKTMREIATKRLSDPIVLSARDLVSWVKTAADIERLAMGLATEKTEVDVNIDLSQLSDAELQRLAQGELPQHVLN